MAVTAPVITHMNGYAERHGRNLNFLHLHAHTQLRSVGRSDPIASGGGGGGDECEMACAYGTIEINTFCGGNGAYVCGGVGVGVGQSFSS